MNETLLVVDDEPGIVAMMRAYFEMNGYRVATAQSGEEALAKISCRPDLILLDIPSSGSVTYDGQDIHSGSGWRSPATSSPSQMSSLQTNPPATRTARAAARSCSSCKTSGHSLAKPSLSSPMMSALPARCPGSSPSWTES